MSISTYFYEPFHDPFFTISDFSRLFDAVWDARERTPSSSCELSRREQSPATSGVLRPRMDLHDSKETDEMIAMFELPGMKKEDVSIDVHHNLLVVSGQSTISEWLDREGYAVRERRFGNFSRTLPLPTGITPEDIKASMENGVLTVKFPKSRSDQAPTKIVISWQDHM